MTRFSKYLRDRFTEWQIEEIKAGNSRPTATSFAKWMGVSQPSLSQWLAGNKVPDSRSALLLASKLGLEIYEILNIPIEDPDLLYIQTIWDDLSLTQRQAIREMVAEYLEKE